jgi:hypothetical protein
MHLRTLAVTRAAGGALFLLLLAGCQRPDADYAACSHQVQEVVRDQPVQEPSSEEVLHCMARKGWRAVRPHLPPGSNAWARTAS